MRLSQGSVHTSDSITLRPSLASAKGSRPRETSVSPEAPLLTADTPPARPRPWLRLEATLTKSPRRLTRLQEHLTQRWPDTFILTRAPRQSRSDRRHFAAPLTGLTEGQRRLRHSDCSATRQSGSDRQSGLAKGAIGNSAPPDPRLSQGSIHTSDSITLRPSLASAKGSRPRGTFVSPEAPLLTADASPARPRPWLR